jgi:hypothetical protein
MWRIWPNRPGRGTARQALRALGARARGQLPPRDYGLAARLLAHAAAQDEDGGTRRALRGAAESLGREIAATAPPTARN